MKLTFDREADALYLELDESEIYESEEVAPGVILDYSKTDRVVGIEVLGLSHQPRNLDLSALMLKTA
ncbi:MAG: DUF2283 domain-containing protein [Chloroflexi bacterium]|nr:DUF2283 domain-containing protein [Chloroflexota bacterium]MXX79474.1 DUF2283 domain-containing protein [Chloroflexota bacterium]MYD15545.1 DUF2283 domain-containing protein [Chloroflexota bacterium]MYF23575.1 DUF2283 domain-containing protein [Chloroflexota bacterium]MYJ01369.1 DUF2283 domain-containing protein [Chloroflexota bacterium]